MRAKLMAGAAALALTAGTILVGATPASAARWGGHRGWGWGGAVAAGVIGGAVAAATSPLWAPGYYDYYPGYAYAPGYTYDYGAPAYTYDYAAPAYTYDYVAPRGDAGWCEAHFRSYNPATGMYLGYDGRYHSCP
jgi:hypothetical protein